MNDQPGRWIAVDVENLRDLLVVRPGHLRRRLHQGPRHRCLLASTVVRATSLPPLSSSHNPAPPLAAKTSRPPRQPTTGCDVARMGRRSTMARLVYSAIASLDGYVADADGKFDWSAPDEEVHAFVNDLDRGVGTFLLGRRMYEVLVAWETMRVDDQPEVIRDFQEIWRAADKIVYSRTLEVPSSERTRIEREFDPETVRQLKAASERDLGVGGPELAAQAIAAGLVDEY